MTKMFSTAQRTMNRTERPSNHLEPPGHLIWTLCQPTWAQLCSRVHHQWSQLPSPAPPGCSEAQRTTLLVQATCVKGARILAQVQSVGQRVPHPPPRSAQPDAGQHSRTQVRTDPHSCPGDPFLGSITAVDLGPSNEPGACAGWALHLPWAPLPGGYLWVVKAAWELAAGH